MNIKTKQTPSFPPQCLHVSPPPLPSPHPRLPLSLSLSLFFKTSLVRPLVLVELGVVVGLAVLHGDAARQDGGHVVAHGLPLRLLLPLLLHLPQLDTWRGEGGEEGRTEGRVSRGVTRHSGSLATAQQQRSGVM